MDAIFHQNLIVPSLLYTEDRQVPYLMNYGYKQPRPECDIQKTDKLCNMELTTWTSKTESASAR